MSGKQNVTALFMAMLIVMLPIVEAQSVPGPDTGAPTIDTVQFTHGPQTIITWNTNEPANSKVDYGNTTQLGRFESKDEFETSHSIVLTTTAGETIFYKITSCDPSGNCKSTTTDKFVAGPFFVKADIPRYPRTSKIDVSGIFYFNEKGEITQFVADRYMGTVKEKWTCY